MRFSAKGMYDFLGDVDCPTCDGLLKPTGTDEHKLLGCEDGHAFKWNYDAQDWRAV